MPRYFAIVNDMTRLRVITRALILDGESVLLARNKDANFWYPPGGGWEFESESLKDSVSREVTEETGFKIEKLIDNAEMYFIKAVKQ